MKKLHFLFTFDGYYPSGGLNDLQGSFESLELALEAHKKISCDYYQVATIGENGELVIVKTNY